MVALFAALAAGVCAEDSPAKGDLEARIDQRIREWQPRPEEKRFDQIGWAADIRDAIRLAGETKRPVFLFTHDGRINIGRC